QKFANKDERIIIHRNKVNNVIYEGNDIVDIGIMYRDIDYLAVLDADDEYTSDFILECKNYAVANNLDIVSANYKKIINNKFIDSEVDSEVDSKVIVLTKTEKEKIFIKIFKFITTYWGKLFRIGTLKIIDRSNLIYQHNNGHDTAFSIELFKKAKNIGISKKIFYKYYIYETSKIRTWRKGKIDSYIKIYNLMEQYLLDCNLIIDDMDKNFIRYKFLYLISFSIKLLILKSNLTDYEKQQEILKIGRAPMTKHILADDKFDDNCNALGDIKNIKKICFTVLKEWMLAQTVIEDDIILEFCEIGQIFCASINDKEGWTKFSILHANALIELGNKMIAQGEQEIQELERMLNM
ncbi:MAG: hypothetical protein ATN32_09080, partial [Candidatus Epulonipiscium fishelsonii]